MVTPSFSLLWTKVLWYVMAAFLLLLGGAMCLYPDASGQPGGYPFRNEFLSALGMTKTHEGVPSLLPCVLFNAGLGMTMLALVPFWVMRSRCLRGGYCVQALALVCCCGLSFGLTGVALTPYNLQPHWHNVAVYSAFAMIVPGILIMLFFAREDYCSSAYKLGWLVAGLGLLLAQWLAVSLIHQHRLPSRPTSPLIQKVNVLVFMLWVAAELVLFRRYVAARQAAAFVPAANPEDGGAPGV